MIKFITGLIEVNTNESIESISEIVNKSGGCSIDEEEEDFITISSPDYDLMLSLLMRNLISENDCNESLTVDTIKFYVK